jgi:aldehyde dehydrogenase (NAD+)
MLCLPTSSATLTDGATLLIDGEWSSADHTFNRFDPSVAHKIVGTFASATPGHVSRAYEAAAGAQIGWSHAPAVQRANILRHAADLLEMRIEKGARRLTADTGKAIRAARAEILHSAALLRYFAGELLQPSGEFYPSADTRTAVLTVEVPVGIACVVTPWSFPFALPTSKLAPAIGFGNTVVWKPAQAASGSAVFLTETLIEAGLPSGVLNLVTGDGRSLSTSLTGDVRLAALSFAGSRDVGLGLRKGVADRNIRVEVGGGEKSPAVVLADADLEDAAAQIVRGAMLTSGTRCATVSHVYVQHSVMAEFSSLLRERVSRLVVGDPYDETTDTGPISVDQRATVAEDLEHAHDEGAHVIFGGMDNQGGCSMKPTVTTGVAASRHLLREEIFGPVFVLTEVEDFEAALAGTNGTRFGPGAGLFTSDIAIAMKFARRSNSGVVHINHGAASDEPDAPLDAFEALGSMCRAQGKSARAFFTTAKTVYLRTPN